MFFCFLFMLCGITLLSSQLTDSANTINNEIVSDADTQQVTVNFVFRGPYRTRRSGAYVFRAGAGINYTISYQYYKPYPHNRNPHPGSLSDAIESTRLLNSNSALSNFVVRNHSASANLFSGGINFQISSITIPSMNNINYITRMYYATDGRNNAFDDNYQWGDAKSAYWRDTITITIFYNIKTGKEVKMDF